MKAPQYYVGIDIASASFTCSVGKMEGRWQIVVRPASFANEYDSFSAYLNWLHDHGVKPDNSVICMEATGSTTKFWLISCARMDTQWP